MKVDVFVSFADLPAQVRECASYPNVADFFLSLDWFETLYDAALCDRVVPRIYIVSDDAGRPLGVFYGATSRAANQLSAMTNFYTMNFAPICFGKDVDVRDVFNSLCSYFKDEKPSWDRIEIRYLCTGDERAQLLKSALQAHGFILETYFQYENWYAPVSGLTFEEYFAERPSRVRNTVTRRTKQASKLHAVDLSCARELGDELELRVDQYESIYSSSWKRAEPFPRFMRDLARRCATLGILRLGVLSLDGVPAAAQFWITTPERALIYKLAYGEEFKGLSVGSILSAYMFRIALDSDRVQELDYGVGSDAYKRDWVTTARRLEGVVAHNPATLRGVIGICAAKAKVPLRRLAHRFARARTAPLKPADKESLP